MTAGRCHGIVPPYLLQRLGAARPELAARVEATLRHDDRVRERRTALADATTSAATAATEAGVPWRIYTTANTATLPGTPARAPGDAATGDPAVDEAADGIAGALAMYAEVYDRDSYDGHGAAVLGTVHYERDYDNAFWNGEQLVFGDGDGTTFGRFTAAVDVLGHELTHAVTERTAGLAYQGQSGALNESVSDVFGSCLKQRQLGQSAAEADWLIGAGLFLPSVQGRALRDMAHPGTAYDDPTLGRDPQPADMAHYVDTTDDNGGVHLNSGIPNRAFYLAATAIGGSSADGAGRIWYAALTGDLVGADTDFAGFAAATVAAAATSSQRHTDAVREAWQTVGVEPSPARAAGTSQASGPAPAGDRVVRVARTGGFAGLTRRGEVDLDRPVSLSASHHEELTGLVERIDLHGLREEPPHPDGYVYRFDLAGRTAAVAEHALTPDLRRVADLVLGAPGG